MEQNLNDFLNEIETDDPEKKKISEQADKIRAHYEELIASYYTDEDSDENLVNRLIDDDYLLEELVDRAALLNLVEMQESDTLEKEETEAAYLAVMASLYELSKTMDPLTGFCRGRLEAGLGIRKAFEDMYWPITTQITAANVKAFESLIQYDLYDDILHGRKSAIGALRYIGKKVYAAGAVVFTTVEEDGDFIILLDWIKVNPDMRHQGIGDFLMAEVLGIALQNEGTVVRIDIPVQTEQDEDELRQTQILENFLDSWRFDFGLSSGSDFVTGISDINNNQYIDFLAEGVSSLSSLGKKGKELLKEFFESRNKDYDKDLAKLPYEYFDQTVSCAILANGKIRSLFLVRRFENGNYRYEALRSDHDHKSDDMLELFRHAYNSAVLMGDKESLFFGSFDSEEGMELVANILPEMKTPLYYRGILAPADEEVTNEDWDELRKEFGLSDDKIPDEVTDEDFSEKNLNILDKFLKGNE